MAVKLSQNKRFEVSLSYFLLLLIVLIAIVILIRQSNTDISRFGIITAVENIPGQITNNSASPDFTLESAVTDFFTGLSAIETYNAENLYEKINGKAPNYLDSGFVELITQRFVSTTDENLWMEIEIFDMANARNAFGIFSVQRRPDAEPISNFNPSFSYKTSNAIYFIIDKYYIELVGSSESEDLFAEIASTAQNIRSNMKVENPAEIMELSLFPQDNLIPGSLKLNLNNAFGFDGFTNIFAGQYELNNDKITAFFSQYSDEQTAKSKADSYYSFLTENGAKDKTPTSPLLAENQVKVLDFYGTIEIIFSVGPFIGGIHEAENQNTAEQIAAELFNELSKQTQTQ